MMEREREEEEEGEKREGRGEEGGRGEGRGRKRGECYSTFHNSRYYKIRTTSPFRPHSPLL